MMAHNLSQQRLRGVRLAFKSLSDSQLNEHLDTMLDGCAWGEEPLVIVPDSNRNLVIHGRAQADMLTTIEPTFDLTGYWLHSLDVSEDPGPLIVK